MMSVLPYNLIYNKMLFVVNNFFFCSQFTLYEFSCFFFSVLSITIILGNSNFSNISSSNHLQNFSDLIEDVHASL